MNKIKLDISLNPIGTRQTDFDTEQLGNLASKREVASNKLTIRLLSLMPLTTLLQAQPGFGAVNQLLMFLCLVSFLVASCVTKYKPSYWIICSLTALSTVLGISMVTGPFVNINLVFYLVLWVLLMSLFGGKFELVRSLILQDIKWLRAITVIWCLLVFVSIPLPSSYYVIAGQGRFFGSFAKDSFRLCPTALEVLVFLTICVKVDKKSRWIYCVLSAAPLFCVFMGYSRTYFGVIALMYIPFLKEVCTTKKQFIRVLMLGAFAGALFIGQSSIASKIEVTTQSGYYGFWDTITSGRSSFWTHDILSFFSFDLFHQLVGGGFNKIYEINQEIYINIWAHNDFINLLVTNGYLGIFLYFAPLITLFRSSRNFRIPANKMTLAIIIVQYFINAIFNMEYTYVCASIATSFAVIAATIPSQKLEPTKADPESFVKGA